MTQQLRKQNKNISTDTFGKVPPQARELEEAVLGAILLEKNSFDIASEILTPDCFYVDAHQRIFEAMKAVASKNNPIDLLTVVEQLKYMENLDMVGEPVYVSRLTKNIVSSANLQAHCRIVLEKFMARELIRIGGEMVFSAYEDSADVFDLLDDAETNVLGLAMAHMSKEYNHISSGLVKVVKRVEYLKTVEDDLTGVPTGFPNLDSITHGWQATDLVVIAARPSVGKTSFALNLARNASMNKQKPTAVGFFSLEMSEEQLITRLLSMQGDIKLKLLKTGRIDEYQTKKLYDKGIEPLSSASIYIDDSASQTILSIRAKARRMKAKHKVGLIIIDYLQLMNADSKSARGGGNREQEISTISREMKKLAKELQIPIIALSQLSREVEKRSSPEPKLSDLRESGAIEQDADMVMFLYKHSKDDIKKDPSLFDKGFASIAKHRNGELGEIAFYVYNDVQQWKEHGVIPQTFTPMPGYIPLNKDFEEF